MHEYEIYEQGKLDLRSYLRNLDKKCESHFGPLNKHVYPVDNPYKTYVDDKDFKKKIIRNKTEKEYIKKTCKFITTEPGRLDKDERYYTHIQNEKECDSKRGHWAPETLNRYNKFDKGTCWKTEPDKICDAQLKNKELLRPYRVRYNPNIANLVISNKNHCETNPICKFQQQSAFTYDCIASDKNIIPEDDRPYYIPPSEMPLEDFEQFLENWYINKKHGKVPETGALSGRGDRCKNIDTDDIDSLSSLPAPPAVIPEYISFRKMDPNKDSEVYLKYMKPDEFTKYKRDWNDRKKNGKQNPAEFDAVDEFHFKMDRLQFETDYKYIPSKTTKKKFLPSIPQSILNMIMKNDALKSGNKRGMLAWHSTGSGKTCTAAGIMDAFWDTDRQIIFASSIDAIASNPPFKFHECCMNLFGRFQDAPYNSNLTLIAEAFKKRKIRFLSFAKLSNRVMNAIEYKKKYKLHGGARNKIKPDKTHEEILAGDDYIDLNKCILIIDEVQNLFYPLPNQKAHHEKLEKELLDVKKHPQLKIVILTATPGDNINSIIKLLNIIRNPTDSIITAPNINNINNFKNQIRGLISYFDMSGDDTKFPKVIDSEPIKYPMSDIQYEKYLDAYKTLTAMHKNYDSLVKKNELDKYYLPIRKYSNSLFNFIKDMNLNDFSSKMPHVLDNFERYPNDKHYLYSAFASRAGYGGHGVYALAKEMEKRGYVKLTIKEAKKFNKQKKLPPKGVKRYIIATNVDLGDDVGNAGENLHELIKIYNHSENKDGSIIHVMLASNKYLEALDLKAVSRLHLFEPLITMAAEKQFIGRSARFCSFADKDRSKGEWTVHIHRYMADKPVEKVVDNGPIREKIQDEIDSLNLKLDEYKDIQKEIKDKEKKLKKIEEPGKLLILKKEIDKLKEQLAKFDLNKYKKLLAEKKKELKNVDKVPKVIQNIENIEDRIFSESRERFKLLFSVYHVMKEAAVDCRLLKNFHESTGNDITCAF
jgi:hypothetical protein